VGHGYRGLREFGAVVRARGTAAPSGFCAGEAGPTSVLGKPISGPGAAKHGVTPAMNVVQCSGLQSSRVIADDRTSYLPKVSADGSQRRVGEKKFVLVDGLQAFISR